MTTAAKLASLVNSSNNVAVPNGTANGMVYLDANQSLTAGTALSYNGGAIASFNFTLGAGNVQVNATTDPVLGYERLGLIGFGNTTYVNKARISAGAQGVWSGSSTPTYLWFSTTAVGGTSAVTRYQIENDGTSIWSVGGVEGMRLTATGLGIGTSSPAAKLDVNGAAIVRGTLTPTDAIKFGGNTSAPTSTDAFIYRPADNTIGFGTASSEKMRLDVSGNLGLGVTPSAWAAASKAIDIGSYGALLFWNGTASGTSNNVYYNTSGTWTFKNNGYGTLYAQDAGQNKWYITSNGTAGAAASLTQAMTLDASGNLGIGTSSPANRLDAYDASAKAAVLAHGYSVIGANASNSNGCIQVGATGGSCLRLDYDAVTGGTGTAAVYNTYGGPLTFGTNNTERMRITAGGNVYVGATNIAIGNSTFAAVDSATRTFAGFFQSSTVGGACIGVNATGASYLQYFYSNASNVGSIQTNGSTTSYVTTSDYRLKEDVQPMTGALDTVAKLNPVTYTWKNTGIEDNGFIAHELQEVLPNAVNGVKDAVDTEGKPIYQGIDTSFLVATLTKAIQELKAELDATKAEVAALKSAN